MDILFHRYIWFALTSISGQERGEQEMDRQRGKRRWRRNSTAATDHSKDFFSTERERYFESEEGSDEGAEAM